MNLKFLFFLSVALLVKCVLSEFELNIVHLSDIHSRFFESGSDGQRCQKATGKNETGGNCFGGIARQVTKIKEIRQNKQNVLVLGTGDFYLASSFHSMHGWRLASRMMPFLELNATSLGNHDFGHSALNTAGYIVGLQTRVVTCNVVGKNRTFWNSIMKPSTVVNINGTKVGIIGYVSKDTKKWSPTARNKRFSDEVECVRFQVNSLTKAGVKIIIVLGHGSLKMDQTIARQIRGVDVVVGGNSDVFLKRPNGMDNHTHENGTQEDKGTGATYPTVLVKFEGETEFPTDESEYPNVTAEYPGTNFNVSENLNFTTWYSNETWLYSNSTAGYANETSLYSNFTTGFSNETSTYSNLTETNSTFWYSNSSAGHFNSSAGHRNSTPEDEISIVDEYPIEPTDYEHGEQLKHYETARIRYQLGSDEDHPGVAEENRKHTTVTENDSAEKDDLGTPEHSAVTRSKTDRMGLVEPQRHDIGNTYGTSEEQSHPKVKPVVRVSDMSSMYTASPVHPSRSSEKPLITAGQSTGRAEHPAGISSQEYPQRTTELPPGTKNYPSGTSELPLGTKNYPSGTPEQPNGTIKYPSGKSELPQSTPGYPPGTSEQHHETKKYPTGTTKQPQGTEKYPQETSGQPHGTTEHPHGSTEHPHGSTEHPHGTSGLHHGTSEYPTGSWEHSNSTSVNQTGENYTETTEHPSNHSENSSETTLIIHVPQGGHYLGHLKVIFDDSGRVVNYSGGPIYLDESVEEDNETLAELVKAKKMFELHQTYKFLPDHSEVIGSTTVLLDSGRFGRGCRLKQCSLGDIVADAIKFAYDHNIDGKRSNVNAAVWNSGAIRSSLDPGNITFGDLSYAVYLGGFVNRVKMTGRQLKKMMEKAVADYDKTGVDSPGSFLQVSGIKVVYDMEKPLGNRVKSLLINCLNCKTPGLVPVESDETYYIAMPHFLKHGGDGLFFNADQDHGIIDAVALVAYLRNNSPIAVLEEERIVFFSGGNDTNSVSENTTAIHETTVHLNKSQQATTQSYTNQSELPIGTEVVAMDAESLRYAREVENMSSLVAAIEDDWTSPESDTAKSFSLFADTRARINRTPWRGAEKEADADPGSNNVPESWNFTIESSDVTWIENADRELLEALKDEYSLGTEGTAGSHKTFKKDLASVQSRLLQRPQIFVPFRYFFTTNRYDFWSKQPVASEHPLITPRVNPSWKRPTTDHSKPVGESRAPRTEYVEQQSNQSLTTSSGERHDSQVYSRSDFSHTRIPKEPSANKLTTETLESWREMAASSSDTNGSKTWPDATEVYNAQPKESTSEIVAVGGPHMVVIDHIPVMSSSILEKAPSKKQEKDPQSYTLNNNDGITTGRSDFQSNGTLDTVNEHVLDISEQTRKMATAGGESTFGHASMDVPASLPAREKTATPTDVKSMSRNSVNINDSVESASEGVAMISSKSNSIIPMVGNLSNPTGPSPGFVGENGTTRPYANVTSKDILGKPSSTNDDQNGQKELIAEIGNDKKLLSPSGHAPNQDRHLSDADNGNTSRKLVSTRNAGDSSINRPYFRKRRILEIRETGSPDDESPTRSRSGSSSNHTTDVALGASTNLTTVFASVDDRDIKMTHSDEKRAFRTSTLVDNVKSNVRSRIPPPTIGNIGVSRSAEFSHDAVTLTKRMTSDGFSSVTSTFNERIASNSRTESSRQYDGSGKSKPITTGQTGKVLEETAVEGDASEHHSNAILRQVVNSSSSSVHPSITREASGVTASSRTYPVGLTARASPKQNRNSTKKPKLFKPLLKNDLPTPISSTIYKSGSNVEDIDRFIQNRSVSHLKDTTENPEVEPDRTGPANKSKFDAFSTAQSSTTKGVQAIDKVASDLSRVATSIGPLTESTGVITGNTSRVTERASTSSTPVSGTDAQSSSDTFSRSEKKPDTESNEVYSSEISSRSPAYRTKASDSATSVMNFSSRASTTESSETELRSDSQDPLLDAKSEKDNDSNRRFDSMANEIGPITTRIPSDRRTFSDSFGSSTIPRGLVDAKVVDSNLKELFSDPSTPPRVSESVSSNNELNREHSTKNMYSIGDVHSEAVSVLPLGYTSREDGVHSTTFNSPQNNTFTTKDRIHQGKGKTEETSTTQLGSAIVVKNCTSDTHVTTAKKTHSNESFTESVSADPKAIVGHTGGPESRNELDGILNRPSSPTTKKAMEPKPSDPCDGWCRDDVTKQQENGGISGEGSELFDRKSDELSSNTAMVPNESVSTVSHAERAGEYPKKKTNFATEDIGVLVEEYLTNDVPGNPYDSLLLDKNEYAKENARKPSDSIDGARVGSDYSSTGKSNADRSETSAPPKKLDVESIGSTTASAHSESGTSLRDKKLDRGFLKPFWGAFKPKVVFADPAVRETAQPISPSTAASTAPRGETTTKSKAEGKHLDTGAISEGSRSSFTPDERTERLLKGTTVVDYGKRRMGSEMPEDLSTRYVHNSNDIIPRNKNEPQSTSIGNSTVESDSGMGADRIGSDATLTMGNDEERSTSIHLELGSETPGRTSTDGKRGKPLWKPVPSTARANEQKTEKTSISPPSAAENGDFRALGRDGVPLTGSPKGSTSKDHESLRASSGLPHDMSSTNLNTFALHTRVATTPDARNQFKAGSEGNISGEGSAEGESGILHAHSSPHSKDETSSLITTEKIENPYVRKPVKPSSVIEISGSSINAPIQSNTVRAPHSQAGVGGESTDAKIVRTVGIGTSVSSEHGQDRVTSRSGDSGMTPTETRSSRRANPEQAVVVARSSENVTPELSWKTVFDYVRNVILPF